MASVTYGKCIMANVIMAKVFMAKVFMAKVLWQMKLSRLCAEWRSFCISEDSKGHFTGYMPALHPPSPVGIKCPSFWGSEIHEKNKK